MAKTMTPLALLASQSVAAGTTVRSSVIDVSAMDGGELRGKITNSGSAPTAQSVARVLVARKQSSAPAAAAEGTGNDDWKVRYEIGGGTTANGITRFAFRFGPETAYIQFEFGGHTGNPVSIECTGDAYAY